MLVSNNDTSFQLECLNIWCMNGYNHSNLSAINSVDDSHHTMMPVKESYDWEDIPTEHPPGHSTEALQNPTHHLLLIFSGSKWISRTFSLPLLTLVVWFLMLYWIVDMINITETRSNQNVENLSWSIF